ncbi:MAG: hypothetical protein CMP61_09495 [Flavobacteriales bacterium]|nr:hypothetical protein [Flavobacteriales bacterium]|tara:strand:+ start:7625 stop:8569 length:945 start_codon:yes stop_codon:yes gene_type:complete
MKEFKFTRLSDSNFGLLVPLYKKAFGKEIDEDFLKKKFDTSIICGLKNFGFLAIHSNGDAAAFYGVFPCYCVKNDQRFLVAQSGDTMVDPLHRRKKLFIKLAELTNELCKEHKIKAIFGFPNIFSLPTFTKKLGWTHTHSIEAFHFKVKCLPFIRLQKLFKLKNDFFLNYQNTLLRLNSVQKTNFTSILLSNNFFSIERDASYFSYKVNPKKYILLINGVYLWVKLTPMYLLIGDISECSTQDFEKVKMGLRKLCFKLGVPHYRFQTSPGTTFHEMLKNSLTKLENEYPACGISFDQKFDISNLSFILADNDTF